MKISLTNPFIFLLKQSALIAIILQIEPAFINLRDEDGKTPLDHATSVGNIDILQYLLEKDVECALKRDKNGFFPIHTAAAHGHVQAIRMLLGHCPDPEEMLTYTGQNILHVAAACGKINVFRYIQNTFGCLMNEKDMNGNTPLHMATMNWHPKVVSDMTWDKRVDLSVVNNNGLTALDVAEFNMGESHSYDKVTSNPLLFNFCLPNGLREIYSCATVFQRLRA